MAVKVIDIVGDDTFTTDAGEDLHAAIQEVKSRLVKLDFEGVDLASAPFLHVALLPFFMDETKRLYLVNVPGQVQTIVNQLQALASKKMHLDRLLV